MDSEALRPGKFVRVQFVCAEFSFRQKTFAEKKKILAYRYYLRPAAGRSNLYVLTNAHVTKVLTEPWSKRATGIELIDKEGKTRKLMANKEIILTAGAIGSPQILLQSGIGPQEDLEPLDIPVVKDLPVGRNLQNHVSIGIKVSIFI